MQESAFSVFIIFLKLGLSSFGGPVAHLAYFRQEFVERRRWLTDAAYADLVALCQLLPGPASSQVGIALGLSRARYLGAFCAWLGFTAPSAILLILFALAVHRYGALLGGDGLHGLKVVAVAVVAQALWAMGKAICNNAVKASIAVMAACAAIAFPGAGGQIGIIVAGGLVGLLCMNAPEVVLGEFPTSGVSRRAAVTALALFAALLAGLPLFATANNSYTAQLCDVFYRVGSMVFGGGHVVLPLLQAEVVPRGWLSNDAFLAGYGAAQAVPGPLFTFAAYIGAASAFSPNGWPGGAIAVLSIFLPSFLLICGALPLLESVRQHASVRKTLVGINVSVVGLLLATFYNPVWTNAILKPSDFGLAALACAMLMFWKLPSWLVIALTVLGALLV
jgi:chromate transporter